MALGLAIAALAVSVIGAALAWGAHQRAGMAEAALDELLDYVRPPSEHIERYPSLDDVPHQERVAL